MPVSPSANTFGRATGTAWEIVPSASIVRDKTMKVRMTSRRGIGGSGCRSNEAATTCPPRTQQKSAIPIVAHSTPGMTNAARHEIICASAPATNGPAARPMLPEIPFQPRARPRFSALRTSQAVRTGW